MNMIELALIGQAVVWLIIVGIYLASGQATIFHPLGVYLGFHALVFILRPIFVYYYGFDTVWTYMGFKPDEQEFIRTLIVSSAGLAALATTCLWLGWTRPAFQKGAAPSLSSEQNTALVWMTILLLPLIAYSIYKAGGDTGGQRAANGVYILTKTTGYVTDAQFMIGPLLCLWLLKTRFHWFNVLPIVLFIGYRSWCGWARWTILLFFITIIFMYCWYYRLRWLPAWTIAATVPIIFLFNILGHDRAVLQTYLTTGVVEDAQFLSVPGTSTAEKRREQLDTQDFANFDYLTAVVSVVPKRTGTYSYGTQYLELFTEPIPRILWSGKPVGAPVGFFSMNQYVDFTGLTFSLVGDGWCSGGWVGVIITLALAGAALGLAHRSFWARSNLIMPSMFYLTFLAISPNWFRDGGISVSKFLLFTWLPFLMLSVFTWFLNGRLVPAGSVLLRPGERLRLLQAEPVRRGCLND
jgi:hypothetical protein